MNRSLGSSVGLELFVRRPLTRRLGGFVSYTLSRSMRSIGAESFPARFDRTHVFNLALGYDLGRNWRAGTRFVVYTGFPAEDLESRSTPLGTPFARSRVLPCRLPPREALAPR